MTVSTKPKQQKPTIVSPAPKPATFNTGKKRTRTKAPRRANSTSPVTKRSTEQAMPIPISLEISSGFPSLHSTSFPKKINNAEFNHRHYADGSYANAPHPTELPPPKFK